MPKIHTEKNSVKIPENTENIEKSKILEENIEENNLTMKQTKNLDDLVSAISSAGLDEFMEYIRSPWRMLWPNFVAGIARGVGTLVGAAAVIALIGWLLTKMISLPLIGERLEPYITDIQAEITRYTESTNYNGKFEKMNTLLEEIRDELKKQ